MQADIDDDDEDGGGGGRSGHEDPLINT